jgi:hypothetical protein
MMSESAGPPRIHGTRTEADEIAWVFSLEGAPLP